jgi:transcriptional/translational regulatory protein YebC/TACO1
VRLKKLIKIQLIIKVLFEGVHWDCPLIETATDNNNRTVANVRSYFNKCNGTLGTQGSVEFMFDHTCNFRIPANGLDPEELELELIDFGAEEVLKMKTDIDLWCFCHGTIQKNLKTAILKSFRPVLKEFLKSLKKLTEAEMADVEKLIEKWKKMMT